VVEKLARFCEMMSISAVFVERDRASARRDRTCGRHMPAKWDGGRSDFKSHVLLRATRAGYATMDPHSIARSTVIIRWTTQRFANAIQYLTFEQPQAGLPAIPWRPQNASLQRTQHKLLQETTTKMKHN
jgi:hypothetical protein